MSGLQVPGQLGVKVFPIGGDNAVPVSASFGDPSGIKILSVGGLTKRQELAARFLAAFVSSREILESATDEVVSDSIILADKLLAATEPQANLAVDRN